MMTLLLIIIQSFFWVSDGGIREAWELDREVEIRKNQNQQLRDRNISLDAEVKDLKQGLSAIEERARTDLGMIEDKIKNEVISSLVGSFGGGGVRRII